MLWSARITSPVGVTAIPADESGPGEGGDFPVVAPGANMRTGVALRAMERLTAASAAIP